ncbi:MAG: RNA-binding protein [Mariprofundaceae bacterium]
MSFSCFIQLLIVAAVISLLGYYAQPFLGMDAAHAPSVFATGLMLGIIIGGLVVALRSTSASGSKSSDSETSNIYVGNLPFIAVENDVKNLFSPFGTVIEVRMVKDRRSRRPKGYGFVEMSASDAAVAIKQLDGVEYAGRTLRINQAKKKGEA